MKSIYPLEYIAGRDAALMRLKRLLLLATAAQTVDDALFDGDLDKQGAERAKAISDKVAIALLPADANHEDLASFWVPFTNGETVDVEWFRGFVDGAAEFASR